MGVFDSIVSQLQNGAGSVSPTTRWLVTLGGASLVGYHYLVVKKRPDRRAVASCRCGKVEIQFTQPAANYSYLDAPCFQCGCTDCTGYVKEVLDHGSSGMTMADFGVPGVATSLLYNSEIKVSKGEEYLQSMKLSAKTENRRVYSKCCGTPLAICPDVVPWSMIYTANMKASTSPSTSTAHTTTTQCPMITTQPTACAFSNEITSMTQEEVQASAKDQGIRPAYGPFMPRTIVEILSRILLLSFVGSYGPGQGIPVNETANPDGQVDIGKETIAVTLQSSVGAVKANGDGK